MANEQTIQPEYSKLLSENKNLKEQIDEFAKGFTELRTQFNEIQLFNRKLSFVVKLLLTDKFTQIEKEEICSKFDVIESYQEAKKLYLSFLKEDITTNK